MSSVAELRRNAEQCFFMAERTRDRDIKASWAQLAETWLSLADQEIKRRQRTTQLPGDRKRTVSRNAA
jgi:hypothetical protein